MASSCGREQSGLVALLALGLPRSLGPQARVLEVARDLVLLGTRKVEAAADAELGRGLARGAAGRARLGPSGGRERAAGWDRGRQLHRRRPSRGSSTRSRHLRAAVQTELGRGLERLRAVGADRGRGARRSRERVVRAERASRREQRRRRAHGRQRSRWGRGRYLGAALEAELLRRLEW